MRLRCTRTTLWWPLPSTPEPTLSESGSALLSTFPFCHSSLLSVPLQLLRLGQLRLLRARLLHLAQGGGGGFRLSQAMHKSHSRALALRNRGGTDHILRTYLQRGEAASDDGHGNRDLHEIYG